MQSLLCTHAAAHRAGHYPLQSAAFSYSTSHGFPVAQPHMPADRKAALSTSLQTLPSTHHLLTELKTQVLGARQVLHSLLIAQVPMHLSVAFAMHSQAFAAASKALEERPPVLLDTPRSNQHTPNLKVPAA